MRSQILRLAPAALLLAAAAAPLALAAPPAASGPPMPTLTHGQPVWLGFAIMFVLAALVIAVSLMPSRRSHQD
jgi:hypothetical protein